MKRGSRSRVEGRPQFFFSFFRFVCVQDRPLLVCSPDADRPLLWCVHHTQAGLRSQPEADLELEADSPSPEGFWGRRGPHAPQAH